MTNIIKMSITLGSLSIAIIFPPLWIAVAGILAVAVVLFALGYIIKQAKAPALANDDKRLLHLD